MSEYADINRLIQAKYNVVEQSPWHYQVITEKVVINIWPTKRKIMIQYGDGASVYKDVVKAVKNILNPPVSHAVYWNEQFAKMYDWNLYAIWKQGIKDVRKKSI